MRKKSTRRVGPGPLVRKFVRLKCRKHPRYRGGRQKNPACPSCQLILILANQHQPHPDTVLGGLDPYQFIPDLEEACQGLEAVRDEYFVPTGFV